MKISRRNKSDQNNWALKKTLLWVILLLNQVVYIFDWLFKKFYVLFAFTFRFFLLIIIEDFNLYFSQEDGHSNA